MKQYLITVEHHDPTGKYWADSFASGVMNQNDDETLQEAIVRHITYKDNVDFSYKGKPQSNIYRDVNGKPRVVGYVYRTKHYIESRSDNIQKENVPFDTWVEVSRQFEDTRPILEDIEQ